MKKRLVLVTVIILILSFALAGCNMFVKNVERDNDQVVASVKHNGLVSEITKYEFYNYFYQYSQYMDYFKWTADTAGENFISILARRKMTLILAVEKFSKDNDKEINFEAFNAINKSNASKHEKKGYGVYANYLLSLLDWDEQKYVKEQTNKIFEDSYNEYIDKKVEAENINNSSDKTDEEKENIKEPRPTQPEDTDTSFKKDPSVGEADVKDIEDFFTKYDPAKPENSDFTKHEINAYKDQKRYLEERYLTYDYFLAQQAETRLLTKYQESDEFKDKSTEEELNVKINEKYKKMLDEQMKSYATSSSYKSAIEGDSTVIYHNGRFVKVKSILLQFSDDQKAALDYIKNITTDNDTINALREALVFGNFDTQLTIPELIKDKFEGLMVYKSNPDYDPKKPVGDPIDNYEKNAETGKYELKEDAKPADKMNYPYIFNPDYNPNAETGDKDSDKWVSVPFLDIISEIGKDIADAGEAAKNEYKEKYPDANDPIGEQMYINQKKIEKFEWWIYQVNDDSGMFEGNEYTETPMGNSSDYVVEYTALVRQLLLDNNTAGSVMVNTNGGKALDTKFNNLLVTEAKVAEDTVRIYTDSEANISFIVNDFGVHIVMLTTVPVDFGYNQEDTHYTVEVNKDFNMKGFEDKDKYSDTDRKNIIAANSFYTLTLDAYVGFDEETGKAITLREQLTNELKETYNSDAYSKHTEKLFDMYGDKLFSTKDDKTPSEGYADFKFELSLKKSVFNSVVKAFK